MLVRHVYWLGGLPLEVLRACDLLLLLAHEVALGLGSCVLLLPKAVHGLPGMGRHLPCLPLRDPRPRHGRHCLRMLRA